MLVPSAQFTVVAFGLIICFLCIWGLVVPSRLIGFVKDVANRPPGIYVAVAVRVVLGVALLVAAPSSMFPLLFSVLGGVTLAAAAGLVIVGRAGMRRLVSYFAGMPSGFVRVWLVLGFAFGALLVHGAW